ncbi:MAG: hypothetical protein JNM66_17795 [Bryobacterales bacterium]|nr:hypothetical protein [Bryobacterales bacterium]
MEFRWKLKMRSNIGLLSFALSLAALGQVPVTFNTVPSRAVGQAKLQLVSSAPNLVDGRELYGAIGVALDTGVTPPTLFVADTNNNRVLVWRNGRAATGSRADLVLGQNDFFTTSPLGPGTTSSVGLRNPTGLTVDNRGNLYVIDTGNNRILRYPRLTAQQGDLIQPNLVIGQNSFSANLPNQGNNAPLAKSLALAGSNASFTASLAFDNAGNLWVTDPGNNRVLRFPASVLGDSASNGPEADLVLGQSSLTTTQTVEWGRAESRLLKSALLQPSAVAFDPAGRMLVTDGANRLVVYSPPFRTGMDAIRIAGLYVNIQGQPARPNVNEYTLTGPEGVFATAAGVFVAEVQTHRIVRFDPVDQWPPETDLVPSPAARAVFGQPDLLSFRANRGNREPGESSFHTPTGLAVANNELYLADTGNHRILVLPLNGGNIGPASRVLGQVGFAYRSINLVEGRELYLSSGATNIPNVGNVFIGGAVVIDRTSNPPRLYIADTFNNRVLGYADARTVKPGDTADLVIGQASLFETKINSPSNDIDQVSDSGLANPVGLAIDSNGNLYVADTANGRVLRFARPFEQPQKAGQRANLVIGQSGFNIKITDPTQRNMSRPYGLAFTVEGHMLVSDLAHNRVLLFRRAASGDFSNGQAAGTVFGQRDFVTATPGSEDTRFNSPMHIATDTDDRLYVCDPGNRRVAIFDRVLSATNNPAPAITLTIGTSSGDRIGQVQGINVSPRTGEIWVTEPSRNRVLRYPRFDVLTLNPAPNYGIGSNLPLAVSIDAFDNLLIAEGVNRVAFHYPDLAAVSAAHFLVRRISPGMIAALYPRGIVFGDATVVAPGYPLPTDLADVQVLVDEVPAPLYFVSPGQINFYVPMGLAPGSQSTFIVQRKSNGQILGSSVLDIATATPAFFTTTQSGQGQIAALNEDNSINTNTNGVARGGVIQLFATGQGFVPNAPPDGMPPSGAVPTPSLPRVIVGSDFVPDANILYSGLAPGLVGVWQLNVRIPMTVPPSANTVVVVTVNSIPSNQAESGTNRITTVIAVK